MGKLGNTIKNIFTSKHKKEINSKKHTDKEINEEMLNEMQKKTQEAKALYNITEHYFDQVHHLDQDHVLSKDEWRAQLVDLLFKRKNNPQNQASLFYGLKSSEFKKVAYLVYRRKFLAGEYLFHEGNPGSAMFFVKAGKVVIKKTVVDVETSEKKDVIITTLISGDMFGEMSLLDDSTRSTDAVCVESSEILVLFRADLYDLFKRDPSVGVKIMTNLSWILSERLKNTNNDLVAEKNKIKKINNFFQSLYEKNEIDLNKLEELGLDDFRRKK